MAEVTEREGCMVISSGFYEVDVSKDAEFVYVSNSFDKFTEVETDFFLAAADAIRNKIQGEPVKGTVETYYFELVNDRQLVQVPDDWPEGTPVEIRKVVSQ